ncbi:hypothetical protein ACTQ1U_06455 [Thermoguttaceae bacterium LCP21S3_D4]
MAKFDYPNVDIENMSNEQNIESLKSFLYNLSDTLNYSLNQVDARISEIEESIGGKDNGES